VAAIYREKLYINYKTFARRIHTN